MSYAVINNLNKLPNFNLKQLFKKCSTVSFILYRRKLKYADNLRMI